MACIKAVAAEAVLQAVCLAGSGPLVGWADAMDPVDVRAVP